MRKEIFIELLVIVLLVLISFAIQLVFLNPPILSDQMEYFFTAVKFPHLPDMPNHWSMRIGLIIPVAILYRVIGNAEISYYFIPLVSLAVLSISVYLIGTKLFNRVVGIISALCIIFTPSLMLESGHLLPDLPATSCFSAGIAVLLCAEKSKKWLFFLAGILFGWSYLTKEYMAVLFLLIPLLFWALDIPFRYLLYISGGLVLVFGIELAINSIYYQNPLVRFDNAIPRGTEGVIERDILKIISFLPILLKRNGGEGTAIIGIIAMVSFGVQVFRNDKRYITLFLWVLIFYMFLTLVGLMPVIFSWDEIVLIRLHKFRYWIPILPPLTIGGIAGIDNFLENFLKKTSRKHSRNDFLIFMMLLALLTASAAKGILSIRTDADLIRNGRDHFLELRAYLKENSNPNDIIWIDRDNKRAFERILPMYIHDFWGRKIWDGSFKYLNTEGQFLRTEEINEGFVIIDRDFYHADNSEIPIYLVEIPKYWKLVFESENQEIALYAVK